MIEYLEGTLLERRSGHWIVLAGGVGYGATVPARTAATAEIGSAVRLWVRTYVREEILRLYGFARIAERDAFDLLLTIPGVGPAVALALLSEMSVPDILQGALTGDIKRFTKVKGVGGKLAEKMILELKGKSKSEALAMLITPEERQSSAPPELAGGPAADAVAALEALDVPLAQARRAVAKAVEILGDDAAVEQLVKEGLRHRRTA